MQHYELALPHRDMIIGIGLDSNEFDRPPSLFSDLYLRARADGFRLTAHCDVKQPNTHEHIRQVIEDLGGTGAERVDHGLDAAERPELVNLIKEKGVGMTLCELYFLASRCLIGVGVIPLGQYSAWAKLVLKLTLAWLDRNIAGLLFTNEVLQVGESRGASNWGRSQAPDENGSFRIRQERGL